jgi:hypothetical protein
MKQLIAMIVVLVGGCSFLMTSRPDDPPATPNCQTSRFAPVMDLFLVFSSSVGMGLSSGGNGLGEENEQAEVGFAISGLVALGSAVLGFVQTSQCRSAYEARVYAPPPYQPAGPQPYPVPPPPPFPPPQ